MSKAGHASAQNWDDFERRVRTHKVAVAQVMRVEDQLIELMRTHDGDPPPDLAARYRAALAEARGNVVATATALFPPE